MEVEQVESSRLIFYATDSFVGRGCSIHHRPLELLTHRSILRRARKSMRPWQTSTRYRLPTNVFLSKPANANVLQRAQQSASAPQKLRRQVTPEQKIAGVIIESFSDCSAC